MHAREVVGISHVVIGVGGVEETERALHAYGYVTRGAIEGGENPAAKAPFVTGQLLPAFSMRLLVSALASPPLELLTEDGGRPAARPAASDAILAATLQPSVARVLEALQSPEAVIAPGLRTVTPAIRPQGVAAVAVRSADVDASLALWRVLGLDPAAAGPGIFTAAVAGPTASSRVALYLDRGAPGPGYLNQAGMVCLSFWCRNVDRLRRMLEPIGCELGEPFSIAPFGRPLRGIFARAAGGEVYEFLVPERARKVVAK